MKELTNAVTGREDKTMGIEIEFFGVSRERAAAALNAAGVQAQVQRYNHNTPRGFWKLVTDGSVTSTGTGEGSGIEIVSPPLVREEMARQLKIVCDTLRAIGAKIDSTCGVHVHHDANDLNAEQIKNVFRLYAKHEVSLDTFFPLSRRNGTWAKHVSRLMPTIERCATIEDMKSEIAGHDPRGMNRYHAINFCCYISYGTLEFRQHGASLNASKIMMWATVSQAIVAAAKRKRTIAPVTAHMATRGTLALTRDIFIEGTFEAKFFEQRRNELKRDPNAASA